MMNPADITILDLLRKQSSMTISQFVTAMGVTATAVRQRLNRLLAEGLIEKESEPVEGRGRPGHRYSLTELGRRESGANFTDLAIALWNEIRSIKDPVIQKGLLQRISERLAGFYKGQIDGKDVESKLRQVAEIFGDRQIPFEVTADGNGELPVLNAFACPYPSLAEQDRSVCSMERMLFSELIGETVKLSQCRLDGAECCTFEVN